MNFKKKYQIEGGIFITNIIRLCHLFTTEFPLCLIVYDYEFTWMRIHESFALKRSTRLRGSICNNKKTRADPKGYLFTINTCLLRNTPLLIPTSFFSSEFYVIKAFSLEIYVILPIDIFHSSNFKLCNNLHLIYYCLNFELLAAFIPLVSIFRWKTSDRPNVSIIQTLEKKNLSPR